MKMIPETVQDHLLLHIREKYGTASAAAKALDITPSYLSALLSGNRSLPASVLDLIGWEKVVTVTYRPKAKGSP